MPNKHDEGAASQRTDLPSQNLGNEPTDNSKVKYILVLGPRGSGKSTLVNMAQYGSGARQEVADNLEPCTRRFSTCQPFDVDSQSFAFIDSPGFDNKFMSDEEIFVKAMAHLSPRSGEPIKLTGIFYIHPQDDDLESRTLRYNLEMLGVLIGQPYRNRVTVFVKPRSEAVVGKDVSASLSAPQTPFYHFYGIKNPGNMIWTFRRWTWSVLKKTLLHYSSLEPKPFHAQNKILEGTWNSAQLIPRLKELLNPSYAKNYVCGSSQPDKGEGPSTAICPPNNIEEQRHEADNPITGDPQTEESNAHPDPEIQEKESANQDESEKESVHQEVEKLRDQLKRAQDDYASLYSDLQVQDNVEESRITGGLDDINHLIEGIAVSVSEHINEAHPGSNLLGALGNTPQLQELLSRFGHIEGKSSLVRSSTGAYMAPEDFFDYAIRATLCQELYQKLFKPFHPALAEEGDLITEIYDRVRCQEPQPIAGRWRRDAFNAINHGPGIKAGQSRPPSIHRILARSLDDLLKSCSGPLIDLKLTEEQRRGLDKLGSKAEEFNQLVKGSVVYLGDFQPVIYSCGDSFELPGMSEPQLDPTSKRKDYPSVILATIALGLMRRYASGRGQRPEETMICKATIVSESFCRFL